MANKDVFLKIKKGQYNQNTDNIPGLIVFDDTLFQMYLEGYQYGPLSAFTPSNDISSNSNNQQLATTKGVYDAIQIAVAQMYENLRNDNIISEDSPTKIPAPFVYVDDNNSIIEIDTLKANYVYIFNTPIESFTVNNIIDSILETTIYFTVATDNFQFLLPQGLSTVTQISFEKNISYCVSIKDNILCADAIEPYIVNQNYLHTSSQLNGGYASTPTIYENADTNPTVNDVQPNAIYKFGICDTITLSNIPSNTLETLIYWTTNETTTLYLTPKNNTILRITAGSEHVLKNGQYIMSIKDGVIIISKLKSID